MRHLKPLYIAEDLRRLAQAPGVEKQLRQLGEELDQDPRFVQEALRRLDAVVDGHVSKHDN